MQTQILERDDARAKIKVEVPASDVTKVYQQVVSSISRQLRVPGFRPGKAPRGVVETRVGKDAIAQEVRDALVQTYFPQAVQELELTPVAQHLHAHEPEDGQDYSFEAELELYPDFELPDLSQIVFDTEPQALTDELVQENIEALRTQHAALIPVERAAEAGDYLLVETVGAEGEGSSIPVDLENVSPELAEQFVGRAIGDEIELTLDDDTTEEMADEMVGEVVQELVDEHGEDAVAAFAETLDDDDQAGADEPEGAQTATAEPTTLRVVLKDVKAKERPDADDEFAKTLGLDTWAEVETQVRRNLTVQLEQNAMTEQQEEFTEKLLVSTDVNVPESLKTRRKSNMLQNLTRDLERQNLTLQGYLESLDAEEGKREEFDRDLDEAAEGAVKRDLVLEKLLEQRGTQLSGEEFDAALAFTARRQQSTAQALRQELGDDGLTNYRFLLTRDKAVRETVLELLSTSGDAELPAADADPVESE